MTSNMTMTAISICDFLKLIVKSTVEHYTEDFKLDIKIFKRYAKEAQETGKPVSMLWFCRSCGTYLCPEEDAYKKDTPMFITFKYYDEQEEEEARTIKAFLVTVTGMEGQKPVGYITPINYADECDRIRRYAVPAEKVELVYDKGSLVQNNGNYTILKHPKLGTLQKTKFLADDPDALDYALHKFNEEREAWFTNPTKTFSYLDCDGVVKERTLALNISLRYTLYDGGYNFATLLYAVYSDVNGWTIQMEKE